MNLRNLLPELEVPDMVLAGLSEHTDEVGRAFGFIATAADAQRATDHAQTAQRQGAAVILAQGQVAQNDLTVPVVDVERLNDRKGDLAQQFYGDPTARQATVGVTGTNGKTSIVYHLCDLSSRLGVEAGYFGTLGWGHLGALEDTGMTTTNAVAVQRQCALLLDDGVKRVAMEVSSHALAQNRVKNVHFDYAIFTNLTRDHLDYHGSFEAYGEAKARLFKEWPLKCAVVNVDDPYGESLAQSCDVPVITYGRKGQWSWEMQIETAGAAVNWQTPEGTFSARLPVVAEFAVANITAAMIVLRQLGHSLASICDAIETLAPVPGRMQVVDAGEDQGVTVVVDYAHTPDALEKALATLRGVCNGKLICLVGCGGDRDKGKRPQMARIASTGADEVWLTSDNPRSEDPLAIIQDMQVGLVGPAQVNVDRAQAIAAAISSAHAADVVLIAGKGHETYQEIQGARHDFDDVAHAVDALTRMATETK